MTPSVSMTALELASITATNAASIAPSKPADPVVHQYDRFNIVCIQINHESSVSDFVPALQAELARNGVESRVYEVLPPDCRYSIEYRTQLQWDQRLFSSDYSPYMSSAYLELRENGRLMASSNYEPSVLNYDKWSSTRDKIAPSVRVLVYGVMDGRKPKKTDESGVADAPAVIDLDQKH